MARYTPEFLAALRQRYEQTDQPMRALALEFGIGISTLSAIVEREGWVKRSQRQRGASAAAALSDAQVLLASLHAPECNEPLPPPFPFSGEATVPFAGAAPAPPLSAAERLETLLLQEIAAEETARAELGALPRLRADADACARRLAIMTQTLRKLQELRAAEPTQNQRCPHCADDMPEDMDAFRDELARRIDAFMESRGDEDFEDESPKTTPDGNTRPAAR